MVIWSNGGRTTWYRSLRTRRSVWLTNMVTFLYRKLMIWRSVDRISCSSVALRENSGWQTVELNPNFPVELKICSKNRVWISHMYSFCSILPSLLRVNCFYPHTALISVLHHFDWFYHWLWMLAHFKHWSKLYFCEVFSLMLTSC